MYQAQRWALEGSDKVRAATVVLEPQFTGGRMTLKQKHTLHYSTTTVKELSVLREHNRRVADLTWAVTEGASLGK